MTPLRTPKRFQFLNEKLYFCPHIAESANIAGNAQYRRILFAKKLSAILGLPLYWIMQFLICFINKVHGILRSNLGRYRNNEINFGNLFFIFFESLKMSGKTSLVVDRFGLMAWLILRRPNLKTSLFYMAEFMI